jgi:hypothetical protein
VTHPSEDLLVRRARREAALALAIWAVAFIYSVSYCYLNGYDRTADSLTFVLWFPDWVFWGIVAPWGVCILLSIPFAYRLMGDEPLGDAIDSEEPPAADEHEVQHA